MSSSYTIPDVISSSVNIDLKKNAPGLEGHSHHHAAFTETVRPFSSPQKSSVKGFFKEFGSILGLQETKRILIFLAINVICTTVLVIWCHHTDSMALTAYSYLTVFDILSLLTCLLSIWVKLQKPTPVYSFGYERFEVLATFASTMLAQLGSMFIIKESIERIIQQPDIHTGRLMVGVLLAFFVHVMIVYCVDNQALRHVMAASSSSWLQEHMTDISQTICSIVPGLSRLLLPRINPLILIAFSGGFILTVTHVLIDTKNYFTSDTIAAVILAVMTCGTMFPMAVYTGKILLQTTPVHMLGQLDKVLREASTLDGVLEFREEHFWTLSFGTLAGSVQVRVRRDANEQLVLAHVYNRLSNVVSNLTIQVFKDDWTRASSYSFMATNAAFPQHNYQYTGPTLTSSKDQHGGHQGTSPFRSALSGAFSLSPSGTSDQGHGHSHGPSHGHSHTSGQGHSHFGHGHSH